MHSPAAALAWEFWRRHRWGLAGVTALVLGFALASTVGPLDEQVATVNSMFFVIGLCHVIGVFAYGFDGRLEAAESGFPARLFVLPVRTGVLVGLPMAQGVATAVALWVVWDRLVLRPAGVETPGWWALMLAAIVATSQALVWLPFGLPWLRLLITVPVLVVLVRSPFLLALAGDRFAGPDTQAAILGGLAAGLVPTAYLVAWVGVARARRGEGLNWLAARSDRRVGTAGRERPPFASPMRAQVWYEWRTRGRAFVALVGVMVAALMALGVLTVREADQRTGYSSVFLFVPVVVAGFWGAYMGTSGVQTRIRDGLSAYHATRPFGNAAWAAARLWSAALAAAAAWAVVVAATLGWLAWTGTARDLAPLWDLFVAKQGAVRAGAICALAVTLPVLVVWRMLAVNLWVGMTGRAWPVVAHGILFSAAGLKVLEEWVWLTSDPTRYDGVVDALPWLMGGAVVLKLFAAAWAVRALLRRGEVDPGTVGRLLVLWLAAAAVLFALLAWLLPEGVVPVYALALGVPLFVPLTRLAVAPLALSWNRHR